MVYSSVRKSRIKVLDRIHNKGIRYSLGLFSTTPVQSIHCESGMMPLEAKDGY